MGRLGLELGFGLRFGLRLGFGFRGGWFVDLRAASRRHQRNPWLRSAHVRPRARRLRPAPPPLQRHRSRRSFPSGLGAAGSGRAGVSGSTARWCDFDSGAGGAVDSGAGGAVGSGSGTGFNHRLRRPAESQVGGLRRGRWSHGLRPDRWGRVGWLVLGGRRWRHFRGPAECHVVRRLRSDTVVLRLAGGASGVVALASTAGGVSDAGAAGSSAGAAASAGRRPRAERSLRRSDRLCRCRRA